MMMMMMMMSESFLRRQGNTGKPASETLDAHPAPLPGAPTSNINLLADVPAPGPELLHNPGRHGNGERYSDKYKGFVDGVGQSELCRKT
jgi:hypothetical protein